MLSAEQVGVGNVTFEPGCRNNWHIHHADEGDAAEVAPSLAHVTQPRNSHPAQTMKSVKYT